MRTTKRFTPRVLDFFREQGRGIGTYESYIPWHRVSRSDPASYGRSHLIYWRGRYIELLSDLELILFCFAARLLKNNNDLREQFPLSLESAPHELSAYDVRYSISTRPGTLEIAQQLNIKHPRTNGNGRSAPWVMSTDLLLTLQARNGERKLIAIAGKGKKQLGKRAIALLEIERHYWRCRGVKWLLITPHLFEINVARTLQRTWPWALNDPTPEDHLHAAQDAIYHWQGYSFTFVLKKLEAEIGNLTKAQNAVWQAIWAGRAPVDLRRGWRPHLPLQLLPTDEFDRLNPVLSGRSAWT